MSFFCTDDPDLKKERARELVSIAIGIVIGNIVAIPFILLANWFIDTFLINNI